jgi:hypothetical protein
MLNAETDRRVTENMLQNNKQNYLFPVRIQQKLMKRRTPFFAGILFVTL